MSSTSGYTGPELAEWLEEMTFLLREASIPFALIGGASVMLYGQRSRTRDIDFLVQLQENSWPVLDQRLTDAGLRVEAKGPWHHRVWRDRMYADLILAEVPVQTEAIAQARMLLLAGIELPVAPPEFIVALKRLAGRPQDLRDIAEIREGITDLDEALVARLLAPFQD